MVCRVYQWFFPQIWLLFLTKMTRFNVFLIFLEGSDYHTDILTRSRDFVIPWCPSLYGCVLVFRILLEIQTLHASRHHSAFSDRHKSLAFHCSSVLVLWVHTIQSLGPVTHSMLPACSISALAHLPHSESEGEQYFWLGWCVFFLTTLMTLLTLGTIFLKP